MENNPKIYAPVLITTLNRFEKFKMCVESLANNPLAKDTELVIGLDYPPNEKYFEGYEDVRNYLPQIAGFKKIKCFVHEKNIGQGRNIRILLDYAKEHYDKYIFTEDDNEFSPCFLDYMNQALERYEDEPKIAKISGYVSPVFYGITHDNIFCNKDFSAYGLGGWFKKSEHVNIGYKTIEKELTKSLSYTLKLFFTYPALIYMAAHMITRKKRLGDVANSMYALMNDAYILNPSKSLVRNWGTDGSGLHSGVVKGVSDEKISTKEYFGQLDNIEIKAPQKLRRRLLRRNMPKNPFKYVAYFIYKFFYVVKIYFQYK